MYQTCSFRATISQKYNYLIRHYAISGFGWTYLYMADPVSAKFVSPLFFSKFLSFYVGKCFILLGMCGTFCSLCLVYRNAEDLNKSGILCCLASMFVPCIPLMLLRGEAREKYGIEVRIFIIFMIVYFFVK